MTSDIQSLRKLGGEQSASPLDGKEIDAQGKKNNPVNHHVPNILQGNAQLMVPINNSTNSAHLRLSAPSTIIYESLGDIPAPLWLRDRHIESHVSGPSQNPSHTTVRPRVVTAQDQYQPGIVQENQAKWQAPLLSSSLSQEHLESEHLNRYLIPDPLRTRKPTLSLSTSLQSQKKPVTPPTRNRPGSFFQQALSGKTSYTPRYGGSPFELPEELHYEEVPRVRRAENSPVEASSQYTENFRPLSLPVRPQRELPLFTPRSPGENQIGGSEDRWLQGPAVKQRLHAMDPREVSDAQMIGSNDKGLHRPTNQRSNHGMDHREITEHFKVYNAKRISKWIQQATIDEIMEDDSDDSVCNPQEWVSDEDLIPRGLRIMKRAR